MSTTETTAPDVAGLRDRWKAKLGRNVHGCLCEESQQRLIIDTVQALGEAADALSRLAQPPATAMLLAEAVKLPEVRALVEAYTKKCRFYGFNEADFEVAETLGNNAPDLKNASVAAWAEVERKATAAWQGPGA